MTKTDFLNAASDLRRAAYWTVTGKNKRFVVDVLKETRQNPELKKHINISCGDKREYLAEDLLMGSQKLQRLV